MRRTYAALFAAITLLGLTAAPGAPAYENGKLPLSAVSPIASGVKCPAPAGQLVNQAAADYNSAALAAGEKLPVNGCDSAYRSYERQLYYWNLYISGVGNLAAYPGTSNHGRAPPIAAVDVPEWVQGWFRLHGARFCWLKTEAFSEPWHWTHTDCPRSRPNPGPSLKYPRLRQGSGGPGQTVHVRKVQKLLRGHGDKLVTVDGDFGWQTRKAVERFQKAERIKVTGVVNRRTWKRLRQPVTKPVKTTPKAVPPAPAQPAPKAPEVDHPKPRPPKNRPAWGIDVSSNNGPVDFKAVRRDGADFACVKATEGQDYIDAGFGRKKMRSVGAAGLVPCVYHYLRPRADRPGAREAAWFTQVIGQAGYGKGFLPPVLDVEETELSPSATCRYVGSFLRLVRRNLGVKPVIYTFPSFASENFSGCSWLGKYRLWIAHIGVSKPSVPAPWSTYALWQYTWTGKVAGVNGGVDVNKVRGGRNALVDLRVRKLPRRARLAPRARLALPLAAESKARLTKAAVPGDVDLAEAPVPEGVEAAAGGVGLESTSAAALTAELIHVLLALAGE